VFAGTRAGEFEQRAEGATYAEIAARGGGIRSTVRLTREAGEADLLAAARGYGAWFLRGGTTTIEAKSGYGLSLESELKILRVIRQLAAEGACARFPRSWERTRSPMSIGAASTTMSIYSFTKCCRASRKSTSPNTATSSASPRCFPPPRPA